MLDVGRDYAAALKARSSPNSFFKDLTHFAVFRKKQATDHPLSAHNFHQLMQKPQPDESRAIRHALNTRKPGRAFNACGVHRITDAPILQKVTA